MTTRHYYSTAAVRELDRLAIEEEGIPGFELMQRAGSAAFNVLQTRWAGTEHVRIFCGTGNNGGDGFVLATLAMQAGLDTRVYLAGEQNAVGGDARLALEQAQAQRVPIMPASDFEPGADLPANTLIVDALLGTGLSGEVRPHYRQLIEAINHSAVPVLALDIPSGLCSDTGRVLGSAVRAEATVTFIGRKAGQRLEDGPLYCGTLIFDDLGVPDTLLSRVKPAFTVAPEDRG